MNRQLLSVVVPLSLIGACISAAAAEPSANNKQNEFAGKIVAVRLTTNEKVVLENVTVITHGGESFLAGTGITRSELNARHDWWEGLPVRLNLRLVLSYFPLTPEQWKDVKDK